MEAILQYLDNFTPEFLIIETALLVVISFAFVVTWIYNKKKYQNLKHQIPAGVVKSYLDSIIQNSVSLKSSLFRGGGLELDEASMSGMPQVVSLDRSSSEGATVSDDPRLKAELAQAKKELEQKNNQLHSLEEKLSGSQTENKSLLDKIKELEAKLAAAAKGAPAPAAAAPAAGGDDTALRKELADVTKERDELRNRLKEYEIIEDDLANLKRLQQENEQLKKALAGSGGAPAPQAEAAPAPKAEAAPAQAAAAEPAPAAGGDQKSPEDLLSEFEKMLG